MKNNTFSYVLKTIDTKPSQRTVPNHWCLRTLDFSLLVHLGGSLIILTMAHHPVAFLFLLHQGRNPVPGPDMNGQRIQGLTGKMETHNHLKPMRYEPDIPGPGPWLTGCCWPQRGTGEELGEEAQGGVSKVSHRDAAVKHRVLRHQICGADTGEPESRDN